MTRPLRSVAFITMLALTTSRASVAQVAPPAMVGRWSGEPAITVNWTRQRVLPIDITIGLGDTVRGSVANALLDGGRIERGDATAGGSASSATDYIIVANLAGAIIRAENIWRQSAHITFNRRDTILEGVLTTSGWPLLRREVRTSTARFVLQRAPVAALSARAANAAFVVSILRCDSGKALSRCGGSPMPWRRCGWHPERERRIEPARHARRTYAIDVSLGGIYRNSRCIRWLQAGNRRPDDGGARRGPRGVSQLSNTRWTGAS